MISFGSNRYIVNLSLVSILSILYNNVTSSYTFPIVNGKMIGFLYRISKGKIFSWLLFIAFKDVQG